MQTTLAQFNETQSQDAFALQNSKLLKVRLGASGSIQAKAGSMVAYQGNVSFEHAGSGGLGRMLKKAVTGEGTTLMKMAGDGEVFLADTAQDIHLIYLEGDTITVNGPNLLAFDADIDWDIKRIQGGASAAMAGGLYNMELRGTGWVAILSDGPPVLLNVASAPTFADAQAAITWSSGVSTSLKTDFKMKDFIGKSSGETLQMAFGGQGWVLVQPSEGRVTGATDDLELEQRPRRPAGQLTQARCSDVDDAVVGGVVHDLLAVGAPPARLERGAADRMAQRLAVARGARAPVGEQPQRARELASALRELVDEAGRPLGVRARDDERLLGERLQPGAEDVGRDPAELLGELVEALGPGEQRRDRQQRPPVADARDGVRERRGGRVVAVSHARPD